MSQSAVAAESTCSAAKSCQAAYVREAGAGAPVVCIHSSASSAPQWRSLSDRLATRFRVIAVDLYGSVRSPACPDDRPLGWYRSDPHQRAVRSAFPNQAFDREPLPDTPEDSGPILAIVSLKLLEAPRPDGGGLPIASIGIELYTPLPGGVAVGGRFAPDAVKVRGLREIDLGTAQDRP